MLDSDMLVTANMDELMTMDLPEGWIAATHACTCNPLQLKHYPKDWSVPVPLERIPTPSLTHVPFPASPGSQPTAPTRLPNKLFPFLRPNLHSQPTTNSTRVSWSLPLPSKPSPKSRRRSTKIPSSKRSGSRIRTYSRTSFTRSSCPLVIGTTR